MEEKPAEKPVPSHLKEWTREDLIACILSALSYVFILAGCCLLLLNHWIGWLMTALALVFALIMYRVIDPKLRRISAEYEKKQNGYLDELDKILEWKKTADS